MISRQREWQKKQQKLGNCIICGKPASRKKYVPGVALFCTEHRGSKLAIQKAYYHRKKVKGICYSCDARAVKGKVRCVECAEKARDYQEKRRYGTSNN